MSRHICIMNQQIAIEFTLPKEWVAIERHREEVKHDFFFNYTELWEIINDFKERIEKQYLENFYQEKHMFRAGLLDELNDIRGLKSTCLSLQRFMPRFRNAVHFATTDLKSEICFWISIAIADRIEKDMNERKKKFEAFDYKKEFDNAKSGDLWVSDQRKFYCLWGYRLD